MTDEPLDLLLTEDVSHLASPLALGHRIFPNFRVRPHQKIISDAIVDAVDAAINQRYDEPRKVCISVPFQFGKALSLDTPVPTPSGWIEFGDLRVGDWVFGGNGLPTRVVAVTPAQLGRPCYAVRTDDREVIVADAEHLWVARLDRHKGSPTKLHPTKTLAKTRRARAQLPIHGPLELPKRDLPIPPYTLGLWLGDGSSDCGAITSGEEDREELRRYVEGDGFGTRLRKDGRSWGVLGLHKPLREQGLLGSKHIPKRYLRASRLQRLALLQGLVDSDGHVDLRGHIEFTTTREGLVEDFLELVRSLGVKVNAHKCKAFLNGIEIGPKWSITFYHGEGARLQRKRDRLRWPKKRHRFVDAVEVPSVPVRCIEVEAEDGMFLVGRAMVPTHNSQVSSILSPAWYLELYANGVVPGGYVGLVSAEDSLVLFFSNQIRRLIEKNPDVFASKLAKDTRAASFWETEAPTGEFARGGVLATGVSGSIVGRPISLLVIDDPIKTAEQANSEKHREMVWDFWQSVGLGRLQPWTVVLIVMTRWAEDDLIGRLVTENYPGDPKEWRYIKIPAVANEVPDPVGREIGDALIRPQFDGTQEQANYEMERVRASTSEFYWQTLWQQEPRDPEGAIFYERCWRYWHTHPTQANGCYEFPKEFDQVVMSWDCAFKDAKDSDWVVGTAWGAKGADRYLIDLVRARMSFTETKARVKSFAETIRSRYDNAITVLVEDKANGPAIVDALRSTVGGLVEFPVHEYGSKLARAHTCQPLLLGGNLYIPSREIAPWVEGYVAELAAFRGDKGQTDDMCDSSTQAWLHMDKYQHEPTDLASAEESAPASAISFTRYNTFNRPLSPFRR